MPRNPAAHLSDDELAALDADAMPRDGRARAHLQACETCRRRHTELTGLRSMLARTAEYEQSPRRDMVVGAVKRLRLRRHAVNNANELFGSLVSLVRGLASLFAAGEAGEPSRFGNRPSKDDRHG